MSKHTQAPWRASQAITKYGAIDAYWLVYGTNGVQVADLFGLTGERDEDGDDIHISNDEARANAALIAAAPLLLEALERLVEATARVRKAEDDYMRSGQDEAEWPEFEDAHATLIIRENEARRALAAARPEARDV